MIVVKIQGGLGNQLFQYALVAYFKEKLEAEIVMDISFYQSTFIDQGVTKRIFELEKFTIQPVNFISSPKFFFKKGIYSKLKRFLERNFLPYYQGTYVKEKRIGFDSNILTIKNNCYLDGYWQSLFYFKEIETVLIKQLKLKRELSDKAKLILSNIKKANESVSLHIRRGDYMKKYSDLYYHLTIEYYIEALKLIKKKLNVIGLRIFVFSDDIEWCLENLKFENETFFVSNDSINESEELILMASCGNNIIANSSFSWWGAWLNQNKSKIVVAPKKWFINNNEKFISTLYPESWNIL